MWGEVATGVVVWVIGINVIILGLILLFPSLYKLFTVRGRDEIGKAYQPFKNNREE
jgi:hypothetical protein